MGSSFDKADIGLVNTTKAETPATTPEVLAVTSSKVYTPRVFHFRFKSVLVQHDLSGEEIPTISPRGGVTIAVVPADESNYKSGQPQRIYFGVAVCSPSDNYWRKLGRKKAVGNAISNRKKLQGGGFTDVLRSMVAVYDSQDVVESAHHLAMAVARESYARGMYQYWDTDIDVSTASDIEVSLRLVQRKRKTKTTPAQ